MNKKICASFGWFWFGLMVFTIVIALASVCSASPSQADAIARKYGIDPALLQSVCEAESDWRPQAIGDGGKSIGLCQINPETALRMFPKYWNGDLSYQQRVDAMRKLLFNPEANMAIAAIYLKYLIAKYHGDVTLAVAAYNAGESSSVVKHIVKVKRKMAHTYAAN